MLLATVFAASGMAERLMLKPFVQAVSSLFSKRRSGPQILFAICIDHQTREWLRISQGDLDYLLFRLQQALQEETVEFNGQDDSDVETRLYLSTRSPKRVLPVLMAKLREITWCRGSRVLVQSGRFGLFETHLV